MAACAARRDVVKMICLGANRVGFGTLPMVAAGCTICRACQKGTCHVGITTQINSVEEAQAAGLKHFVPCDVDEAVTGLVNLFTALEPGRTQPDRPAGFRAGPGPGGTLGLACATFRPATGWI